MVSGGDPQRDTQAMPSLGNDERATKLVTRMLEGNISEIKPELDFASEMGFTYPFIEETLNIRGQEAVVFLESLASNGILNKDFFDRFLNCPQCRSVNLRPTTHCPKCASGNIARGRVLEHSICGYVGLEEEFVSQGSLISSFEIPLQKLIVGNTFLKDTTDASAIAGEVEIEIRRSLQASPLDVDPIVKLTLSRVEQDLRLIRSLSGRSQDHRQQ
jgi:hypothetical protein